MPDFSLPSIRLLLHNNKVSSFTHFAQNSRFEKRKKPKSTENPNQIWKRQGESLWFVVLGHLWCHKFAQKCIFIELRPSPIRSHPSTMCSFNSREGILVGFGNPLLDISVNADKELLDKYGMKPNDAILADERHKSL